MSSSEPQSFGPSFESLSHSQGVVIDDIHQDQFHQLKSLMAAPSGRLISLRAPRAGYGKTTLLARLRDSASQDLLFVPVFLAEGRRMEGDLILEEALNQLHEPAEEDSQLTRLDLLARRLFAKGLLPMVRSGEVPCQDQEAALKSLQEKPIEAFDFHNQGAAIAHWTRQQFKILGPRLSSALSKASRTSGRQTSKWVNLLFDYATRTPGELARTDQFMDAVFGNQGVLGSRAGSLEVTGSFLNLVTYVQPVVVVLDEVDGLSGDSSAALSVASSLASLWQSAPSSQFILSVNDDIWESAFVPRLPHGLRDRLEDLVIRLQPITEKQAEALVNSRVGETGGNLLSQLDLKKKQYYPREILKQARSYWSNQAPLVNASEAPPQSEAVTSPVTKVPSHQYPPKPVKRAALPVRTSLPVYRRTAPAYPPTQVSRIPVPKRGVLPRYLEKKDSPPVVPVVVPVVRSAQAIAYPPKVPALKPPKIKAPPVYLDHTSNDEKEPAEAKSPFLPTPSPIQGEGFALSEKTMKVPLKARRRSKPLEPRKPLSQPASSPLYPPRKVSAVQPPVVKTPPKYVDSQSEIDSPFVITDGAKKTRWVAQHAKVPPQPTID